jgi:hypothetical protein
MSADEHNRPIHETSPATTPHAPDGDDDDPPRTGARAYEKCVACRQFHGGVNAGLRCLEGAVRQLRRERTQAFDQIARLTKELAEARRSDGV